ncbi:hypothetical protein RJ55_07282 [Drechmeria coniospora]|nr:hypothetical protein RJ55_07282 [Drechmeria coniospora]
MKLTNAIITLFATVASASVVSNRNTATNKPQDTYNSAVRSFITTINTLDTTNKTLANSEIATGFKTLLQSQTEITERIEFLECIPFTGLVSIEKAYFDFNDAIRTKSRVIIEAGACVTTRLLLDEAEKAYDKLIVALSKRNDECKTDGFNLVFNQVLRSIIQTLPIFMSCSG